MAMARATGRLTALKVEKAKGPGMYADGDGLYLRVTKHGTKNWVLRYMLDRRPSGWTVPFPLYGLQEARAKALDARRKRHEGIDPIEASRAERARQKLRPPRQLRSGNAPKPTSTRTAPAGASKHAAQWAATFQPTPTRSSARCQCRQ